MALLVRLARPAGTGIVAADLVPEPAHRLLAGRLGLRSVLHGGRPSHVLARGLRHEAGDLAIDARAAGGGQRRRENSSRSESASQPESRLTPEVVKKMNAIARKLEGKKYDLTFEWSDDRMYCSELVWKIYERALGLEIGSPQKLREFQLDEPAVQAKLRERYGRKVPLDEPVISPAAMFASPELVTVSSP